MWGDFVGIGCFNFGPVVDGVAGGSVRACQADEGGGGSSFDASEAAAAAVDGLLGSSVLGGLTNGHMERNVGEINQFVTIQCVVVDTTLRSISL